MLRPVLRPCTPYNSLQPMHHWYSLSTRHIKKQYSTLSTVLHMHNTLLCERDALNASPPRCLLRARMASASGHLYSCLVRQTFRSALASLRFRAVFTKTRDDCSLFFSYFQLLCRWIVLSHVSFVLGHIFQSISADVIIAVDRWEVWESDHCLLPCSSCL